MIEVRTLARPHRTETDRVKGSRFIGDVAPAGDERSALGFLASVRDRERDATHHCWAYLLDGGRSRSSDDGEPGGTAGAPILRRIESADLTDVVVVVTRYYGGTNLGKGGLVRAYGAAAAAVLTEAPVTVRVATSAMTVEHPYELSAAVEAVMAAHDTRTVAADYGVRVTLRVAVPRGREQRFAAALTEATAGRVAARAV